LSPDDVYLTNGCAQAIEIVVSILARPGANILLPRPGYQFYAARAAYNGVEVRYFNLLPESKWEVDLDGLEALADENTVAMVIVNPGNPCGNTFTYQHLAKANEVYEHLTFGSNPFVPMGMFGEVVPVLTLGSISKRWVVPGWRLGWIVTNDPNGVKLDLSRLEDIHDDMDFCSKLAKEELVIVLPGEQPSREETLRWRRGEKRTQHRVNGVEQQEEVGRSADEGTYESSHDVVTEAWNLAAGGEPSGVRVPPLPQVCQGSGRRDGRRQQQRNHLQPHPYTSCCWLFNEAHNRLGMQANPRALTTSGTMTNLDSELLGGTKRTTRL
ncbi:hypothetical protein B296_00018097, partial [Ensete ventricosum]